MKLIFLIVGLAIGFGGGVFWGVNHPREAQGIAAAEEKQFLQAHLKASETIRDKLNELEAHRQAQAPAGNGSMADREITTLQKQQDEQVQELQQRLNQLQ